MPNLNIKLMNYSTEPQELRLDYEGSEPLLHFECDPFDEDPTKPLGEVRAGETIRVPGGAIHGLVVSAAIPSVTIVNPAPGLVHIIATSGKDPWPPPPPAPPAFVNSHDYHKRYVQFLAPGAARTTPSALSITFSQERPATPVRAGRKTKAGGRRKRA